MKYKSIMNMLNEHKYKPTNIDELIIKKIDTLLENPHLGIELCDKGTVWFRKSIGYKFNMKLTLLTEPNGWIIDKERFVKLGNPLELSFIYKVIFDFINHKNIKYQNRGTTFENDGFENSDDDPFSERNIMRDIKNGEGYKHGLD